MATKPRKTDASAQAAPRPKLRRAEKSELNRAALMRAAAEVIGAQGYEGASIGRITERAGLAQGTFYLYFESRQALFDILLPELSRQATQYIAAKAHGAKSFFELEERGFRGFLEWVKEHPSHMRVLNEAEVAAPKAFEQHFEQLLKGYLSALTRARAQGEIKAYSDRELRAIAYMLIGARNYLHLGFSQENGGQRAAPKWLVESYMSFVRSALAQSPAATG